MVDVDEMELLAQLATERGRPSPGSRVQRVRLRTQGMNLSGLLWGDPPADLVLLHGGSLNAHAWDPVLLEPALSGVSALAIDLPGHGHSDWFHEPLYAAQTIAPVLAPVLGDGHLVSSPCLLVGQSLGGLTALRLAAEHPDLVHRLVVVDATPGSTPVRSQDLVAFAMSGDFASIDDAVERALRYRPHRDPRSLRRSLVLNLRRGDDARWHWRHDVRTGERTDRWEHTFREMPKLWDDAARLVTPMVLVRGGRSPIVLDSDVERYRRLVRDLVVVAVTDAGHNVHRDAPDVIAELLAGLILSAVDD